MHTDEVHDFIIKHRNEKPHELVLKSGKYAHLPIQYIAHQVQCYQKSKIKLPEFSNHERIVYPAGISLEQSSSESTAQYKSQLIRGNTLTDLTGGFGVDSYYFSKVFEQVIYVEQTAELVPVVTHNFELLGVTNVKLYNDHAEHYLEHASDSSDCYFIDPARRDEQANKVFKITDCTPDLSKILPSLLQEGKTVLVKMSPMLDIQQALHEIPHIHEVHIVAVNNECKELLFKINKSFEGTPKIFAVNLNATQPLLTFDYDEEQMLPQFSQPLDYIYEPNAAIMKAGGFNTVAQQFGLFKLHRNSHLYTSQKPVGDFPGRVFKLRAITALSKKKLKPWIPNNKANISIRNYPESVKVIRKKTGIREGGHVYIFATTLLDGSLRALVCQKG